MHKHRANSQKRSTEDYTGPVAKPGKSAAHGGVCYVDHCECGATRRTNQKGNQEERGPWKEPKDGRSGTVWVDANYNEKGYPPRLGTVRFKSFEAYNALERLAEESGKSRTEVLQELVLRESKKKPT